MFDFRYPEYIHSRRKAARLLCAHDLPQPGHGMQIPCGYPDFRRPDAILWWQKESLLYRELFETHYPGQSQMVADFWMPNRTWPGCDIDDPSARVLSNYGASGQ